MQVLGIREMKIESSEFGQTKFGRPIIEYCLTNTQGFSISVLNYGGIVTRLMAPDRNGMFSNIVLGYNEFNDYENNNPYFGAIIGRYANRIRNAEFTRGNNHFTLSRNDGPHHLHGGFRGFDKVIWRVDAHKTEDQARLTLRYNSKDTEEGYPGNLSVAVTYTIDQKNQWTIEYSAQTDKETPINLTQHSYFNLSGDFDQEILDHRLKLETDYFVPIDYDNLPTGKLSAVAGTPFDFRTSKLIATQLSALEEGFNKEVGFDHCFAMKSYDTTLRKIAEVTHEPSGRHMEVFTTKPGVQFYTANFPKNLYPNPQGGFYKSRTGFCLETQHFPDAPNQSAFPTALIKSGETYHHKTVYKFGCK